MQEAWGHVSANVGVMHCAVPAVGVVDHPVDSDLLAHVHGQDECEPAGAEVGSRLYPANTHGKSELPMCYHERDKYTSFIGGKNTHYAAVRPCQPIKNYSELFIKELLFYKLAACRLEKGERPAGLELWNPNTALTQARLTLCYWKFCVVYYVVYSCLLSGPPSEIIWFISTGLIWKLITFLT